MPFFIYKQNNIDKGSIFHPTRNYSQGERVLFARVFHDYYYRNRLICILIYTYIKFFSLSLSLSLSLFLCFARVVRELKLQLFVLMFTIRWLPSMWFVNFFRWMQEGIKKNHLPSLLS